MRRINLNTLRKKKWFQYLRILYLAVFVASFVLVLNDSISILEPKLDVGNSYIECDNGQKYPLGEYGIPYDGSNTLARNNDREARRLCVSDETVGELARASVTNIPDEGLTNAQLGQKIKEGSNFVYQNIYLMLSPIEKNYRLVDVYTRHNVVTTIGWLILPVLALVAIFELELRIFYYIVLGKFLPERPSRYLFFKTRYEKRA